MHFTSCCIFLNEERRFLFYFNKKTAVSQRLCEARHRFKGFFLAESTTNIPALFPFLAKDFYAFPQLYFLMIVENQFTDSLLADQFRWQIVANNIRILGIIQVMIGVQARITNRFLANLLRFLLFRNGNILVHWHRIIFKSQIQIFRHMAVNAATFCIHKNPACIH